MKTFKQFLIYLSESKLDDYKENTKYISTEHDPNAGYSKPKDIIDHFHSFNPTGDVNHTRWVINQYHKGNLKQEDAPSMKDALTQFNKYKDKLQKKKIDQYKTLSDLRDAIRPHIGSVKSDIQSDIVKKGATLLHDSDNLKFYHVHNMEASKELGKGTPWCISHRDADFNRFDHYNDKSRKNVYIAHLSKEKHPYRKLGIVKGTGEFQDENNDKIYHDDLTDLVKRNPELMKIKQLHGERTATTEPKDYEKYASSLALNDDLKHVDISPKIIDNLLDNKNKFVKINALKHLNATKENIDKALNDEDHDVRYKAIENPNATKEHIDKALNDENWFVRQAAVTHPNATKEHIDKALNDEHASVRYTAVSHPNATKEHIDKALNDENGSVRQAAIQHPNATKEHIDKALNDKQFLVRRAAVSHPNATKEHIDKALNDEYASVKQAAIENPNATKEHIDKALNDEDAIVRQAAVTHPNATKEHIDKALNDKEFSVRRLAINHPNATTDHLIKGLTDKSTEIKFVAKQRLMQESVD